MKNAWGRIVLAAALNVTLGVWSAAAQTVVVTNAAPNEKVEVVLNSAPAASGAADARGDARLPVDLQKITGKAQIDASIFVDACGGTRRVLIVERGAQMPVMDAACERHDVSGLYWVRPVNTIVVDVGSATPTVLLIKGSYDPRTANLAKPPRFTPTGLVVFGGGTFLKFRDVVAVQCGDVTDCSGKNPRLGGTAGADFWLTRYLGAEGTYVRPSAITVTGKADTYHFDSAFEPNIFTIAAKGAIPVKIVRIYGLFGGNYHRASAKLTETIADKTITVGGVEQTIKGGTQTSELKTQGWGWIYGGGLEVWAWPRVALYADARFARVKGTAVKGQEGEFSDRMMALFFGLRVHVGG